MLGHLYKEGATNDGSSGLSISLPNQDSNNDLHLLSMISNTSDNPIKFNKDTYSSQIPNRNNVNNVQIESPGKF